MRHAVNVGHNYTYISVTTQGVSKRALQLWKRIEIYTENIHNVLNCQNVAKHTEIYLGYLWFNVTSIGNAANLRPVEGRNSCE
jgi:hypothetical protein